MPSTCEDFEELMYTQRLSDVNDHVRGKTVKKLKTFLKIKSSSTGFTYEELLKIWKGLYYCMYMADKPLFQEDLAEDISKLIHHISDNSQKLLFFQVALDTFAREWNGIDKYRKNKFLMILTRILRQLLVFLCGISWNEAEVKKASDILESSIICPLDKTHEKPLGLKMHITDVILEELAKVGKETLPDQVLIAMLMPFFKVLVFCDDNTYVQTVKHHILYALIRQSELGLKNQEDLALRELELVKNGETDDLTHEEDMNCEEEEEEEDKENEFVMDPRAGGVDVQLPLLRPDYTQIANALLSLVHIYKPGRRIKVCLYKHANKFMKLSRGQYPFYFPSVSDELPRNKLIKDSVARLEKIESNLRSQKRKFEDDSEEELKEPKIIKANNLSRKKRKRRTQKQKKNILRKGMLRQKSKNQKFKRMKLNGKKKSLSQEDLKNSGEESAENQTVLNQKLNEPSTKFGRSKKGVNSLACETDSSSVKTNSKTKTKTSIPKLKTNALTEKTENKIMKESNSEIKNDTNRQKTKKLKQKNIQMLKRKKESNETVENSSPKSDIRKKLKSKGLDSPSSQVKLVVGPLNKSADSEVKKMKEIAENMKLKKKEKIDVHKSCSANQVKEEIKLKKKKKEKVDIKESCDEKQKVKGKKDPWSEPLKKGEVEFEVPAKKYAKKLTEKSTLAMKTPKINQQGRRLKINLGKNKEHEYLDYTRAVASSPGIPFSALKKPSASVLKASESTNLQRKSPALKINKLKKKYKL